MVQRLLRAVLCGVLTLSVVTIAPYGSIARAELITTVAALELEAGSAARERVHAFFDRTEVRAQLEAFGVEPDEAQRRAAALSDAQIAEIDGKLADLPAGGDFLGVLIAILVLVVLTLFITDILGWTDVFPFIGELPRGESKKR